MQEGGQVSEENISGQIEHTPKRITPLPVAREDDGCSLSHHLALVECFGCF